MQVQVTSAREACDSGDNKRNLAWGYDTHRKPGNQTEMAKIDRNRPLDTGIRVGTNVDP
jgi:hypothetical protein